MRILLLIFGCCIFFFQVTAQQFTSLPIGDFATSGPFTTLPTVRKAQMIYTPQELSALGQNGVISKLYFRIGSANPGNLRVLQMQISLGVTNDSNFTSSQFYTGLKRVNTPTSENAFTQPTPIGGYLIVNLDTPFVYDATKSLIVEVSANIIINGVTSAVFKKNARRLASNSRLSTTGTIDSMQWTIGFDYGTYFNNDAAITDFTPATSPLNPGSNFIPVVQISNQGLDSLKNVVVALQVNNQPVIRSNWQGGLQFRQAATHSMSQPYTTPTNSRMIIRSWTENPNGSNDGNPQNDTLTKEYCVRYPGGTLFVGGPSANYATLESCFNDLACRNIIGPTTIVLAPGIYQQSIIIPPIPGQSASNPITIRSASGNPNSVVFRSDSAALLTLDTRSFFRFTGITFQRLGLQALDSGVVRVINCTNIIFDSCLFVADTSHFSAASHRQLNVSIFRSIQVTLKNSRFTGGDVAVSAIGLSNIKVADLRIENSHFENSRYAHLYAKYADVIRFEGNRSERQASFFAYQSTLYFEYCDRIQVLRNRFEGKFNGPVITLEGVRNSLTLNTSNLIANNLFIGEMSTNGPIIQTANLPGVTGSTQVDIQFNNFDLHSNQPISTSGAFILMGVGFPSSVINNLIRIKAGQNLGKLFSFRDGNSFPFVSVSNNVYDHDFAIHAGYSVPGPNYSFADFQALGKDSNSFVRSFAYLPGNQLQPAVNFFNRRAKFSQWVNVDHLNNPRSTTPDIGAYEFPVDWSPRILGSNFSNTDTPNVRILNAEIESAATITQSRLFFRKNNGAWQQANGIFSGAGNRYDFTFNPRLIQPRILPGDTIYYYITANTANDSSIWPVSVDSSFTPALLPYFVYGAFLSGNYSIGTQNRDFANLPLAIQALNQMSVWDTVNFILFDTLYALNTFTIAIPRIKLVDSLSYFILRPADSVHVRLSLPLGANRPIFELVNPRNTKLTGQSLNNTGSLSLYSADTTNRALVSILNLQNQPITNNSIQYLRFIAGNINNQHTGIQLVMTQPSIIKQLSISNNRIQGTKSGIHIQGHFGNSTLNYQLVRITNNEIGNADSTTSPANNGITVGYLDSAFISGNKIQNLISTNHLEDVVGILANFPLSNSLISRNTIYRLQLNHALVNSSKKVIGIQLSSGPIRCIGNEISGLSSINPVNFNSAADVFGIHLISASNSLIAHNSIYLYGQFGTGPIYNSRMITLNMASQLRSVEVTSNLFVNQARTNQPNQFFRILQIASDPEIDGHSFSNNLYIQDTSYTHLFYSLNNLDTGLNFNNWRNYTATLSPPFKDKNSFYLPMQQSPFVQVDKLEPVALLRPYLNQNAKPINFNLPADLNGLSRPALGDTVSDVGAYEVQASIRPDIIAPTVDSFWSDLPVYNCAGGIRTLFARVTDTSGVQQVNLIININEVAQNVNMVLLSGSSTQGIWQYQLPGPITDRWVSVKIRTEDNAGNISNLISCYSFQDAGLRMAVSRDTLVALGDTALLSASSQSHYTLVISEYSIKNEHLHGTRPLPSYLNNPNGDYLEIANFGTDTVNLSGLRVVITPSSLVSFGVFTFPEGTKLPPQQVSVLTPAAASSNYGVDNPDSLYFIIPAYPFVGGVNPDLFISNINHAIFLQAPNGDHIDALFSGIVDFYFGANLPPYVWPGFPVINIAKGSVQLMGADLNSRRNFQYYSELHPGSIGYYQTQLPAATTAQINWTGPGLNRNQAFIKQPMLTSGINEYVASLQSGNCIIRDTMRVRVSGLGNTDYFAPVLSEPNISFVGNCTASQYTLQLRAKEPALGSGIAQVILEVKNQQQQIQLFPIPRINGDSQDGNYEIILPLPAAGSVYFLRAYAIDSNQNVSDTLPLNFIRNHAPFVKINDDTIISAGSSLLLNSQVRNRTRNGLHISEVIYNWGGTGTQPNNSLPIGFPTLIAGRDLVEITNYTQDTLSTDSLFLRFVRYSPSSYSVNLPLPTVLLAPGQQMYVLPGPGVSIPELNFFYLSIVNNNIVDSNQPHGWMLIDKNGSQVISAIATGNHIFNPSENVPTSVWTGQGVSGTSGTAGIYRTSLLNNANAFQVSSSTNQTNIGSSVALQYQYPVIWYANNLIIGRGATLSFAPTSNSIIRAIADTLFCPVYDTAYIQVAGSSQASDVRIKRILSPVIQTNPQPTSVSVMVHNAGPIPLQNIPLSYLAAGAAVVNDTLRSILPSSDSVVFNFNQMWSPPAGPTTPFCVFTTLSTDTNRSNDTLCLVAGSAPLVFDLEVDSILSLQPGEPIFNARSLSIRLVNRGNQSLSNISVSHSTGFQQLQEIIAGPIAVGSSLTHTFLQPWLPPVNGLLTLCFYAKVAFDTNVTNDTICIDLNGSLNLAEVPKFDYDVSIYPLPANNFCWLYWQKESEINSFKLYSMHGKLIESVKIQPDQYSHQLDVESLAQGIYYIRFKTKNNEFIRKMIVQR